MLSFENADAAIQDLDFRIDLSKSQQRQHSGFKTKSGLFWTFLGFKDIMKEIHIFGHLVPPAVGPIQNFTFRTSGPRLL